MSVDGESVAFSRSDSMGRKKTVSTDSPMTWTLVAPPSSKMVFMNVDGTHTSSMESSFFNHPSGRRSVSNIVRPMW